MSVIGQDSRGAGGAPRSRRAGHEGGAAAAEAGPAGAVDQAGPYRLVQRLGEGGVGVVHLGVDERGRGVAIKMLRDHVAHDPTARQRLAREVSTLRRVRHPRVAPVIDADVEGPRPYVVTRYVPGDPLDAWVAARGPLTGVALARLGRGLAEALGAIHDAGVVHRDLKPGNVLVTGGDPVVIDFGIAHVADETRLTHSGLVMGTPGYLSPELLDGDPVDESTDWWAWAATLAFAATGRPPFGTGPVDAVLHRVYRGEADLRGVDPRLQSVLRAALRPRAHGRPGQEEILAALDLYARGGDTGSIVGDIGAGGAAGAAGAGGAAGAEDVTRPVAPPAALEDTQVQPAIRPAGTPAAAGTPATAKSPTDPASPASAGVGGAGAMRAAVTTTHRVAGTRVLPVAPAPDRGWGGRRAALQPGAAGESSAAYVGFSPPPVASAPASARRSLRPLRHRGARFRPGGAPPVEPPSPEPSPVSAAAFSPGAMAGRAPEAPVRPASGAWSAAARPPRRHAIQPVLLSFLLALAALAMTRPLVAALAAAGWAVLARTVEASARAIGAQTAERGRRRSDAPLAVLAAPLRAIPAVLTTLLVLVPSALVAAGASVGAAAVLTASSGVAVAADSESTLAIGLVAGILVGWWGIGGTALRRGSRRTMRALSVNRTGAFALASVLLLVAAYFAISSQASGMTPDWTPLTSSPFDGLVPVLPAW